MELVSQQKQRVWKLPAVINFSCGGIGTGFYLIGLSLMPASGGDWFHSISLTAVIKLLGPALVGLGFIALTTEAGQPKRGINLFRHLRRSWMSRETLAAVIFIPAAGLDWLFPHPALRAVAAGAAFTLLLCQGFIVYRARGVTAWNSVLMPLLFVTSGLATGSGLVLVVFALLNELFPQSIQAVLPPPLVGFVAAILNSLVWVAYMRTPGAGFEKATERLRRPYALTQVLGVGHLVPALLLVLSLLGNPSGASLFLLAVVSGLALIFGGVSQKFGIIIEAGYLRAIVLPMKMRQFVPS